MGAEAKGREESEKRINGGRAREMELGLCMETRGGGVITVYSKQDI